MTGPTKPGFYWAQWLSPAPNTHEAGEWTFPLEWGVVEVWENFIGESCEADRCEKFGVSVPGVRETQWVENFRWDVGPSGRPEPVAEPGHEKSTAAEIVSWLRAWAEGESSPPDPDIMEVADTIESRFGGPTNYKEDRG